MNRKTAPDTQDKATRIQLVQTIVIGILSGCALALMAGCTAPEEREAAKAPEPPTQRMSQERLPYSAQASLQGFGNLRPRSNMTVRNRPAGPMSAEEADAIIDELRANRMLSAAGVDYPLVRTVLMADTVSLARMFSSEYPSIALAAIDEATRRRDSVFVPFLTAALDTTETEIVATELVKAIEELAREDAQQLLRSAVSGESRFGRFAAAQALAERRDDTGEPVLWQELKREPEPPRRFLTHHRAARALLLLRKANSKADFDRILDPLPDTSQKRHLLPLVGRIGTPGAAAKLREYLSSKDHLLRKWSAIELGKLRDRRAVPSLIENLDHSSRDVRIASARALEQIGDPAAIPSLKRAAQEARARARNEERRWISSREIEWEVMENAAFNLRQED